MIKQLMLIPLTVLAACGSGDGSSSGTPNAGLTLGELAATQMALFNTVNTAPEIATADIPMVGSATYNGKMGFSAETLSPTGALVGDVSMTVSFAGDDNVSGTADNFVYVADPLADPSTILPQVDGALTFDNGSINRAAGPDDTQFGANYSGTLNAPVEVFGIAAGTDLDVEGGFAGLFYEGAIVGEIEGTITPTGGVAAETDGSILAVE